MIDIFNNKDIIFNSKDHTYFNSKTKKELIPVSKLIGLYKPEFDKDGVILEKKALENGISTKEMQAEWDRIKDEACIFGTKFHKDAENYLKDGIIPNNENKKGIEQFSKIKINGQIFSEIILKNDEFGVCGTTDIISLENNDTISIFDLKTNKSILKKAYWKPDFMLYPLDHLLNLNFFHYCLQLSLYSYFLDCEGFWVKELKLLHFDKKSSMLTEYEIPYMKTEIINMLNHYKDPVNFKKLDDKTNPVDWI